MKSLKKLMVPRFYGKNPQPQGEEPLLNDEGLLTSTKSRAQNPNKLLLEILEELRQAGAVFECVGTGLKIGIMKEDRKDSVCVIHNVNETSFGVYVLKRPPDALPKHDDVQTDGEPIAGANTKSSRLTIPYEGNTAKPIADFIGRLPSVFESGRKTTFNDGRPKKVKSDKPKAKKNKEKKAKKNNTAPEVEDPQDEPQDSNDDNVVEFTIGKKGEKNGTSLEEAVAEIEASEKKGRRKKNRKKQATA